MKIIIRAGVSLAIAIAFTSIAMACSTCSAHNTQKPAVEKASVKTASAVVSVSEKTCVIDGKTVKCSVMSDGSCVVDGKTVQCSGAKAGAAQCAAHGAVTTADAAGCSAHKAGVKKANAKFGSCCSDKGAVQKASAKCSSGASSCATKVQQVEAKKVKTTETAKLK